MQLEGYESGVDWDGQKPVRGEQIVLNVSAPFCCRVGELFGAVYPSEEVLTFQFVCARLLSILSADERRGRILVEVTDVLGLTDLVRPVPAELVQEFRRTHAYEQYASPSRALLYYEAGENLMMLCGMDNESVRADMTEEYYFIHTDADGIDHLVAFSCVDFDDCFTALGDAVLGLHADSPIQWQNGQLVDTKNQRVFQRF